jgi:type IV pilus assembly protein PilQ
VSKVPLLGDIPGLGWMFKYTTKETTKTELIIFLTPRILDERLSLR